MKARAWRSTTFRSKTTGLLDDCVKKEASSAWFGEKMQTFSTTALWCSRVSGEQDLACGSQMYSGRDGMCRCVRNAAISSIWALTVSGMSKKWKHFAEIRFAAARSAVVEGKGGVRRWYVRSEGLWP